jgi:hypothetical protein
MRVLNLATVVLVVGLAGSTACAPEPAPVPPRIPTASASAPDAYGYEFSNDLATKDAPPPPAAPPVPTGAGRLAPEIIQRVVRANFPKLRACYEAGLTANPSLAGRVAVKFVIASDGVVASSLLQSATMPDEGVVKCTVSAFSSLSFPAPSNGIVTVVYPIEFVPDEPPPLRERVVGTWQFDLSGDRRVAVEAELHKKAGKNEGRYAKLLKEAEDEAQASRFEITADSVTSKIGEKILFRIKYQVVKEDKSALRIKIVGKPEGPQKGMKDGDEMVLAGDAGMISFKDNGTIVMNDPKKGALIFHRK